MFKDKFFELIQLVVPLKYHMKDFSDELDLAEKILVAVTLQTFEVDSLLSFLIANVDGKH